MTAAPAATATLHELAAAAGVNLARGMLEVAALPPRTGTLHDGNGRAVPAEQRPLARLALASGVDYAEVLELAAAGQLHAVALRAQHRRPGLVAAQAHRRVLALRRHGPA